jgi:hypothetical protein
MGIASRKPVRTHVPLPSARSPEVGPAVLQNLASEAKRYQALARTTLAIVKAAKADDRIDLSAAFTKNKRRMQTLNDQIRVVLGISQARESDGKVVLKGAAAKYFPTGAEDSSSEEFKRKETFRGNFATMLKRAAQAAAGIITMDAKVAFDKSKGGTLALAGPAVAKHFGTERIVLDEAKREGQREKPSYTAVAAIAANELGVVMPRGSNTRGIRASDMTGDKEVESAAKLFIEAIDRMGAHATVRQKRAIDAVKAAIEKLAKTIR